MYKNVEVKVTVKVDGQKVASTKVKAEKVSTLAEGQALLQQTYLATGTMAQGLRRQVGV